MAESLDQSHSSAISLRRTRSQASEATRRLCPDRQDPAYCVRRLGNQATRTAMGGACGRRVQTQAAVAQVYNNEKIAGTPLNKSYLLPDPGNFCKSWMDTEESWWERRSISEIIRSCWRELTLHSTANLTAAMTNFGRGSGGRAKSVPNVVHESKIIVHSARYRTLRRDSALMLSIRRYRAWSC
jgi:hypothetical protein